MYIVKFHVNVRHYYCSFRSYQHFLLAAGRLFLSHLAPSVHFFKLGRNKPKDKNSSLHACVYSRKAPWLSCNSVGSYKEIFFLNFEAKKYYKLNLNIRKF